MPPASDIRRKQDAAAERSRSPRRLVVNADDFGKTDSINEAVVRAHQQGILTTTSLMVNEPAFDSAVRLARENPRLGVGLHLTLLCGRSGLAPEEIPGLVDSRGRFTENPAGAGFRYFFRPGLRAQLRAEIHAQFRKFRASGLPLDHVNGHLHLHLHPAVLRMLTQDAAELGIERMRLTFDPFWLNLRLAQGQVGYRLVHAVIFHLLSAAAGPKFKRLRLRHTRHVFGLLQNSRVDEQYVLNLLPNLPSGDSELYSHPSLDEFRNEFDALVSQSVKQRVRELGIELIRYQDL